MRCAISMSLVIDVMKMMNTTMLLALSACQRPRQRAGSEPTRSVVTPCWMNAAHGSGQIADALSEHHETDDQEQNGHHRGIVGLQPRPQLV